MALIALPRLDRRVLFGLEPSFTPGPQFFPVKDPIER